MRLIAKTLLPLALAPALALGQSTMQEACPDVEVVDPETGQAVAVPLRLPEGAVVDLRPKGEWTEDGYYVMRPVEGGPTSGAGAGEDPYGWPDRDLLAECIAEIGRDPGFGLPTIGGVLGRTKGLLTDLVCSSINRYTSIPARRIEELRRERNQAVVDVVRGPDEDFRRCFHLGNDGQVVLDDNCVYNTIPNPESD